MKISILNIFKTNKLEIHELDNSSRDKNIIKQIFSSIIFKVFSVGIGFILVPVLLGKLGQESYGVWAILVSLMQWIALMDIGIGNGLKNKLTEALSVNKNIEAREYVSTAYYSMGLLAIGLIIIVSPFLFLVDWRLFFNSGNIKESELRGTVMIFVYSLITYFVMSLINQVINAVQRNALTSLIPILVNGFFIASLVLFFPKHGVSLFNTTIIYSLSLVLVTLIFSLFFFNEYKQLRPSPAFFKRDKIRSILSLGVKFFVIQITGVIIFSSDNMIITQLFGPKSVAVYSITFMIFNNAGMLVNLITMPLYSSYTEAYTKNNLDWIKSKVILLCKLLIPFGLGIFGLIYFFDILVKLWIKTPIEIPHLLPMFMGVYIIITVWNNIFSYVLGAIGKINLGMYTTIVQGVLNIPLSILFAKYLGMGLNGIILSNIVCLGLSSILSPIQVYYFIFSNKKSKKWEKILS